MDVLTSTRKNKEKECFFTDRAQIQIQIQLHSQIQIHIQIQMQIRSHQICVSAVSAGYVDGLLGPRTTRRMRSAPVDPYS